MKHFCVGLAPQNGPVAGVRKNSDRAAADSYRAAGAGTENFNADRGDSVRAFRDELKLMAECWGTQFADALIADPRWPRCRQGAAIAAADVIVRTAIDKIAKIFVPHAAVVSATMLRAWQDSLPKIQRV